MMQGSKRTFWILWIVTAALSFCAFFFGVKFVAESTVLAGNIVAYLVFSLIFGAVASALYLLKLRFAVTSFLAGLALGFGLMLRAFSSEMSGWEDLAGIMSLFICMVAGLCVGLFIELGRWLYLRLHGNGK